MKTSRKQLRLPAKRVVYRAPGGGVYVHIMPPANAAFEILALLQAAKRWYVPEGVWRYAGRGVYWRSFNAEPRRGGK
jgi:hypothetical protein